MRTIIGCVCLLSTSAGVMAQQAPSYPKGAQEAYDAAIKRQNEKGFFSEPETGEGKDPAKVTNARSILADSDILCYKGLATLVPKQAILAVPKTLEDRIGMKDGAKVVTWLEFYTANRGWLTSQEITLPQAQGRVPLDSMVQNRLVKSSNIVVATLQGGPISRLGSTPPPTSPPTN